MKQIVIAFFTLIVSSSALFAQSEVKSPAESSESSLMKISYGAPSKKGREIFGGLVPFGKVWRTGANAATEITFKSDVKVGGISVKAGTYSIFSIPGESEWTIIINSELKQWGAYKYDKIKSNNVAEVKVAVKKQDSSQEKMSITASETGFSIAWDMVSVNVPVSK
ncbi:MAG: DUF2911 domain-containing protein [Leadbetterella sp.]